MHWAANYRLEREWDQTARLCCAVARYYDNTSTVADFHPYAPSLGGGEPGVDSHEGAIPYSPSFLAAVINRGEYNPSVAFAEAALKATAENAEQES